MQHICHTCAKFTDLIKFGDKYYCLSCGGPKNKKEREKGTKMDENKKKIEVTVTNARALLNALEIVKNVLPYGLYEANGFAVANLELDTSIRKITTQES